MVAVAVLACGTIVGVVDLWKNGDGQILAALITLYGTVLGFVFGRSSARERDKHLH